MKGNLLIVCMLSLFAVSCVKPDQEDMGGIVADAKAYVEENITSYNLPIYGKSATKAAGFSNSVSLDWEKAIVNELSEKTVVEVPFSGPFRLKAAYMTVKNGKKQYRRAATMTYLVLEMMLDGSTDTCVETFIKRGKKCDVSKFRGSEGVAFMLISDLDGNLKNQFISVRGKNHEMPQTVDEAKNVESAIGFRLAMAKVMTTKSCPQMEYLFCPWCYSEFYGNVLDYEVKCPNCHHTYYDMYITNCPTCGKPWTDCGCQNAGNSCESCGRNPATWPCDDECAPRNCTCGL